MSSHRRRERGGAAVSSDAKGGALDA